MVPAYDDPKLWLGHSSMVHEIHKQLQKEPDAIFCSVGGGGLLGGIILGCKDVGWEHVPIVALETNGSDCFYQSMSLNNGRFNSVEKNLPRGVNLVYNDEHSLFLAHFTEFSSKASGSLGASEPSAEVVKMALERPGGVKTVSVPDELSMEALALFANDHKFLVELACSTTLVPGYHRSLFNKLVVRKTQEGSEERPVVVFIVCGGFKIDLATVGEYQSLAAEDRIGAGGSWIVKDDDGQKLSFEK